MKRVVNPMALRWLGLITVVVALAAFVHRPNFAERDYVGSIHGANFIGPSSCVTCSTCGLSTIRHVADYDADGANKNAHSWCMDFPPCSGHPLCGATQVATERALKDVLSKAFRGDSVAIRELFRELPEQVRFNGQRVAVQVVGCKPDVIMAHLPLSPVQVAAIADLPQVRQELAVR